MNETDTMQEVAAPAQAGRPRVYAPWMIGVLIVFFVCEGLFFVWGYEAVDLAVLGLFAAGAFGALRLGRIGGSCSLVTVVMAAGFVLLILTCFLLPFFLPLTGSNSDAIPRCYCASNMRRLGDALCHYHDTSKKFPPAFVADEEGRRMHGWRTLILPYLEKKRLFDAYDFQQPWDSPENQKQVGKAKVKCFQCPTVSRLRDKAGPRTDYVAVLGDDTLWPTDGTSRSLEDIKVDPGSVAMLIEIKDSDISWYEPRDLMLEDFLSGKRAWSDCVHPVSPCGSGPSAFYEPDWCRHVVFADGSIGSLRADLTPDELRRLFSIHEPFDVESSKAKSRPIVFRHRVFDVWIATLALQFIYVFFPMKRRKEHGCTG